MKVDIRKSHNLCRSGVLDIGINDGVLVCSEEKLDRVNACPLFKKNELCLLQKLYKSKQINSTNHLQKQEL